MTTGVGLCFLGAGLAAYRGWWTSWLGKGAGYTILGEAWLGMALILISVAAPLGETGSGSAKAVAAVLGAVGIGCLMVAALSPFWMWWRLLPQWVRTMIVACPRLRRLPRAGR